MIRIIVSVKDVKAQEFVNLVHFKTDMEAMRFYMDALDNKNSPVNKHPEDYQLWNLGSFNTETGAIEALMPRDLTPYQQIQEWQIANKKGD